MKFNGKYIKETYNKWWDLMIQDPKYFVRIFVLAVCTIVVVFQLTECFHKLTNPPITTHSHFDLNETMMYPAITFCRNPPYKLDVLKEYGLSQDPKHNNVWRKFAFDEHPLDEIFERSTYNVSEYFQQYGLKQRPENVNFTSLMNLHFGRCHTALPLTTSRKSWKDAGYSFLLYHDSPELSEFETTLETTAGWHVFIHDESIRFSETYIEKSGRVEYMYLEIEEEVEVKLTVQHFATIPSALNNCEDHDETMKCEERCLWETLTSYVNCTAPWIPNIDLPYCSDFASMNTLLKEYEILLAQEDPICECHEPCNSFIFSAFVMNRRSFQQANENVTSSQIYFYYTSKMVSILEERPGYDLSQFVSDMGGSLGFLLGLSVLGLIGILEKIFVMLITRCCNNKKRTGDKAESESDSFRSEATIEVKMPKNT